MDKYRVVPEQVSQDARYCIMLRNAVIAVTPGNLSADKYMADYIVSALLAYDEQQSGNAAIPHPNTDECTAACNNTVPDDDWSGSLDPSDPDNFWIDDATGERVNAHTGERSKAQS